MKPKVSSWRTGGWIAACVAVGVLVSSCGSDDPDQAATATVDTEAAPATSPTTPGTATSAAPDTASGDTGSDASGDPCADRDALRESIGDLADVDLVADGTNGLTTAIDAVSDDLAAVRESAGDDMRPEVDAVRSALDDVQTALSNGPTDDLEGTADAVSTLASSTSELLDALDAGPCADSAPATT